MEIRYGIEIRRRNQCTKCKMIKRNEKNLKEREEDDPLVIDTRQMIPDERMDHTFKLSRTIFN